MNSVGKGVIKKDAMALVTGQPVYCDDLAPKDCLIIKLLRSPHAYAKIRSIDTSIAKRIPGIEAVYTYEDVPTSRFTLAGQSYPEPSPYDRRILENVVRYVGDEVAIVAGTNEDCVDRALKAIKVDYEVLEPLLNFEKSIDNAIVVHEEDDYKCLCEIGNDVKRNIVSSGESVVGDVDAVLKDCEVVLERDYHTKANAQAMMETMRSYCYIDTYGRLNCVSSTQIPFHVRRILSNALEIPKSKINVVKPRIGGGFGAKQTACCEIFTAFVTWKLKKPSKIVYTREETFAASNSRHEMKMHVRIGATKDGTIEAIDLYTLSNQGAYGEHGPTTIGLAGHKSLPLYNHVKASRFTYDVVYTNTMRAGAYRGYGATQGQFAVESIINELADELDCAPSQISYVLSTRFSNERGFDVESRRGLGGYIRIKKINPESSDSLPAVTTYRIYEGPNTVERLIDMRDVDQSLFQLLQSEKITRREAQLMHNSFATLIENVDVEERNDAVRQLYASMVDTLRKE